MGSRLLLCSHIRTRFRFFTKVVMGFDLLGRPLPGQARKVAELLNEHALDLFVTRTETGGG
jgi:hypothetical protein